MRGFVGPASRDEADGDGHSHTEERTLPYAGAYCDAVTEAWAVRVVLEFERGRVLSRLRALDAEFEGIVTASMDTNGDDEHDPEGATTAFERERTAALRDQAEARLGDVDRALARVVAGKYGFCRSCRRPIATERLKALPVTELCTVCASDLPSARGTRVLTKASSAARLRTETKR
jgi:DnaK suppressor protein